MIIRTKKLTEESKQKLFCKDCKYYNKPICSRCQTYIGRKHKICEDYMRKYS